MRGGAAAARLARERAGLLAMHPAERSVEWAWPRFGSEGSRHTRVHMTEYSATQGRPGAVGEQSTGLNVSKPSPSPGFEIIASNLFVDAAPEPVMPHERCTRAHDIWAAIFTAGGAVQPALAVGRAFSCGVATIWPAAMRIPALRVRKARRRGKMPLLAGRHADPFGMFW
jgi:hypothetical protein